MLRDIKIIEVNWSKKAYSKIVNNLSSFFCHTSDGITSEQWNSIDFVVSFFTTFYVNVVMVVGRGGLDPLDFENWNMPINVLVEKMIFS